MATKTLLTGGAGFIGSHIAVELLFGGRDVVIADDLSNSGADIIGSITRISGKEPSFYRIDVADKAALDAIFSENDIDSVIHLAGCKAVGESVRNPVKYYRNNLCTVLALLEVMKQHRVNTFVFSSSATVYGDPETVPLRETAPTGRCANPYGRTKYFIEQILTDVAAADTEMSVVLLRYFNPIGAHESGLLGELPGGEPNNLMPYITQTAAGKWPILNIFGNDYPTPDGTGVRDYIHVVDLAKGHIAALEYALKRKGVEAFNLGTGQGQSVLEIVTAFGRVTGKPVPYRFAPRRLGDVAVYCASTEKAQALLGWKAEKSLDDMCRDAWRWQQNCLAAE